VTITGLTKATVLERKRQIEANGISSTDTGATKSAPLVDSAPARTRSTRITVDLDGDRYTRLQKWVAAAAVAANPDRPRFSQAAAIRAMIDVTTADESIALVVIDLMRRGGNA
jgi:hypothetical protein